MASTTSSVFYEKSLVYLSVICVLALLLDRYVRSSRGNKVKESADDRLESGKQGASAAVLSTLTRKYLVVYAIVMGYVACYTSSMLSLTPGWHFTGADWLQGPYVYSLYREQYEFPERLVAVLFVTGFVSAGLAAPLVGVWADEQ